MTKQKKGRWRKQHWKTDCSLHSATAGGDTTTIVCLRVYYEIAAGITHNVLTLEENLLANIQEKNIVIEVEW